MNGPSKHLTWEELACKDGTPYPEIWKTTRAVKLSAAFEMIRETFGDKPITVVSAYRTATHNRKIKGARNSQHVQGRALDLRPPTGTKIFDFYRVIKAIAPDCEIKGIGLYKTFVHIDIRPTIKTAYWKGTGVKDSLT